MISLTDMLLEPIDPVIKGIQDYAAEKNLSIFGVSVSDIIGTNQPVEPQEPNKRFLLEENDSKTFINDLLIDRCYQVSTSDSYRGVDHTTDSGFQFTEARIKQKKPFSVKCKFSGEDHKEKMKKMLEIADSDEPLTLFFNGKSYESLMVMAVSEEVSTVFYSEFSLELREYQTIGIKKIPSLPAKKVVGVKKVKKTGKKATTKTLYSGPPTPKMTREQIVNANVPSYAAKAMAQGSGLL